MLTTILGAAYATTIAGSAYNMAKIRLNDDYVEEIKQYREYDFTYEKVDPSALPRKSIVHVKIDPNEENFQFAKEPKLQTDDSLKENEKMLYSRVISFSNLLDPALYFHQKFGK